jgi:hypothetical protein
VLIPPIECSDARGRGEYGTMQVSTSVTDAPRHDVLAIHDVLAPPAWLPFPLLARGASRVRKSSADVTCGGAHGCTCPGM